MLQDDITFRDDSVVSRGRVAAAGPFAGRDRRRFRSAQCDARLRIQPCPRPVSECHVPSALPDSASIPAGTSSLKRYADDPGGRNLGETSDDAERSDVGFSKMMKGQVSLYIILKSSFSTNISPRDSRVDETRICPTCYDLCIFSIANTIEIR